MRLQLHLDKQSSERQLKSMPLLTGETEEMVLGLYDMGEIGYVDAPGPDAQVADPDYPEEVFRRLKSGRMSPHYVNCRNISGLSPHSPVPMDKQLHTRELVVDHLSALLDENETANHLLGIPQAMTTLAAMVAQRRGTSVLWLRVPEEGKKAYGAHDAVQGAYAAGENVEAIDNVITDGASKLEVVSPLSEVGLQVLGFSALVDREEGGREAVEAAGYRFSAVIGMRQIVAILAESRRITPQQAEWDAMYRERHFG